MHSRDDIVQQALSYVGVPFLHQGRAKSGLDCCGLVIRIAHDFGISSYDARGYSRRTTGDQFIQHFRKGGLIDIPLADLKHGSVLITKDGRFPCHCGIIQDRRVDKLLIHAYARRGKVVVSSLDAFMDQAVCGFDYPGVDEG